VGRACALPVCACVGCVCVWYRRSCHVVLGRDDGEGFLLGGPGEAPVTWSITLLSTITTGEVHIGVSTTKPDTTAALTSSASGSFLFACRCVAVSGVDSPPASRYGVNDCPRLPAILIIVDTAGCRLFVTMFPRCRSQLWGYARVRCRSGHYQDSSATGLRRFDDVGLHPGHAFPKRRWGAGPLSVCGYQRRGVSRCADVSSWS
jgi:hypothetical protein